MFIKSLKISSENGVIRDMSFRKGLNLIVDDSSEKVTGNDVGKTTVLKLVDFCLGAKANAIYVDPESRKDEYALVKDFLKEQKVLITMVLKEDLDVEESQEIVIERNFLSHKNLVRSINGKNLTEPEFLLTLSQLIFPNHLSEKPTFRQIISHNIRYDDESVNNTLRTLDKYSSDVEYETLHLFLLGCEFSKGKLKQELSQKLIQSQGFKATLEKNTTKTGYETALSLLDDEIAELIKRRNQLNLNENYETDLGNLSVVRQTISQISSDLGSFAIRKNIIYDAINSIQDKKSNIDIEQLRSIYNQTEEVNGKLQKTFEELVEFHNSMMNQKLIFITKDLPILESKIKYNEGYLKELLLEERRLASLISGSDPFEDIEALAIDIHAKYQKRGEYRSVISQISDIDKEIEILSAKLEQIDSQLFSEDFEHIVKLQKDKFNKLFSSVSMLLYNEQYALNYDIIVNKKGQKLYKFNTFNTNFSSGKKQGEISCFDIAYTFFADSERMPCLHFILNDKKELMHDNQLVKIANLVSDKNIQFIASILADKLPSSLNKKEYFVVELSDTSKLFKIESMKSGTTK